MKKLLSLLLSFTLLAGCFVPAMLTTQARADDNTGDSTGNTGIYTNKTAVYNSKTEDYTITLEAYATGEQVTTTVYKDKPTDIILVLDQSSSMADSMGDLAYALYTKENRQHSNTNSNLYYHRFNSEWESYRNLYYKLHDGTYVSVSVKRTEISTYTKITNGKNNSSGNGPNGSVNYWSNQNNLYAKVNGEYQQVTVTRERKNGYYSEYIYTYKIGDTTIATSTGDSASPTFTGVDDNCLYYVQQNYGPSYNQDYQYSYYYTDDDGNEITITTSEGNSTYVDSAEFYYQYTESGVSRLKTLKDAVTEFAGEVKTKSMGPDGIAGTSDDVAFGIAVVGFGSDERSSYTNSELFIGSNQYNYNGNQISEQYKNALQDISTDAGYNNVIASINSLTANGGTAINLGTEMANNILNAYKDNKDHKDRAKVVIIFTDGVPEIMTTDSDDTRKSYANKAINNTYFTKNQYSATVYTIGVFNGADARNPGTLTDKTDWDDSAVANKFLHILSSNYLAAVSMDSYGALNPLCKNGTRSYYLSAGDADSLNAIFGKINSEIQTGGSSSTLDSSAVIRDIIAPQFQLPVGASASDITLKSYACTGKTNNEYDWEENDNALGATATVNGDTVSVTGFNFSKNWVGTETTNGTTAYRGNKLVISFTVKPKDGFLGGNDVYTNTSAGVYENAEATEPVKEFNRPAVNVPIKDVITASAGDQNVYLLATLKGEDIVKNCSVQCGSVELDLSKRNDLTNPYGLEDWQYKDTVTGVIYTGYQVFIRDANGNELSDFEDLQADTTYQIYARVYPITETPTSTEGEKAVEKSSTATGNINVFKPELTFKDSEVYYGDTAPSGYTDNKTGEVWKHGETLSTAVTMIGKKPELSLTYTPETGKITEDDKVNTKSDFAVDVTVKIGDNDVTEKTNFVHTTCNDKENDPTNGKFWLHVKTCTLTVCKAAGTNTAIGKDEYFVFNIKKDGQNYTQVTIQGSGSVEIKDLPVGTYTVEEDASTAWRYDIAYSDNAKAALNAEKDSGSVTVTNTMKNEQWLNFFNRVINTFGVNPNAKQ